MSKSLFNMFPDISSKEWKQKIQVDLKGADYNDTLIWKTNEGIDVKPFYHKDNVNYEAGLSNTAVSKFKICETIVADDLKSANVKAIHAVSKGAEALRFILSENQGSEVKSLLNGIDTTEVKVYIEPLFLDSEISSHFDESVIIITDIIGNLAETGNWFENLNEDHLAFNTLINSRKTFGVNTALYQNAGANIVQQLAYSLAHANEYLNHLDSNLDENSKQSLKVVFNVAVGTNYFFEIAKLRALRVLWKTLANAYNVNPNCHIFAVPTKRNKTLYDYNTNMLRTTTECMSAILGGADTINNMAYDAIYHKNNEFGDRISRNQLLILKHESYFDKVDNPADGSYYIESLTTQLSEKALEIFKEIEKNGGFLSQLKAGTIQRKIKENAKKEQEQFNAEELVLLGTNKFPNPEDKMKNELEKDPFIKHNPVKTLVEPIIQKRLSEKLDINRLNNE